ncbi:MAG TPA: hypothetical protein DF613_04530 [Lachnospiraceae bacterium]|nr:hypothetical protein [Lachnospiraceae bacterium]
MEITAEMLFYRLSKRYALLREVVGTPGLEVRDICLWRAGEPFGEDGVLYLLRSGEIPVRIPARGPGMFFFCGPGAKASSELLQEDTYAVLAEEISPDLLQTECLKVCNELMRWDARFFEAVIHREEARKVMAWGQDMLDWAYAVIDVDFNNLYSTPDYRILVNTKADYIPREVALALMMNPDFHAVAELRESFYYFEEYNGYDALCGNIFLNGSYCARVVMYVGGKGSRIPAGARAIFERFTAHLEELFACNPDLIGGDARDQLHHLFQALATDEKPDPSFRSAVLKKVGWKQNDLYTVIKLRFYEAAGWNTQLATTLPYLIRELEEEWPNSCAVMDGLAVFWVINMSLSKADTDQHSFHQRVASFVRDHVCNAGISSRFCDFSLVPYAVRAADVALRIGQTKHPHFWYYLFDDYRLEYMLGKVREELPDSILCHPAMTRLTVYDGEHHTELSKTLRAYLECNLNMTAAAGQLYIHRTTFCRRMDHIRRLTGLDTADPDTILTLLLSYRLYAPE